MPYLKIQTSQSTENRQQILKQLSTAVSEALGKPENYIMVALEDKVPMCFAGETTPAAFVELKSLGLPESQTAGISARISETIENILDIPVSRIYIEFSNAERHMWGWNGATFG